MTSSSLSGFSKRLRQMISAPAERWSQLNFEDLAIELFALQLEHNAILRRLLPERVTGEKVRAWTDVPAIPAAAFKEWDLTCIPPDERSAIFHSSGTTEQRPSRNFHGPDSLQLYEASLLSWFNEHLGATEDEQRDVIILTPPPIQAPHSSLVHMFETIRLAEGAPQSAFKARAESEAWALNFEVTQTSMLRAEGKAMLVLGTAFSFVQLCDWLRQIGTKITLGAKAFILETGGYKGRSRTMTKPELHSLISQTLGVTPSQIVCEYGMSELSSQAYDLSLGRTEGRVFRFPPWARSRVISPETACEVDEGATGLLRVYDLANVFSVMCIQTEDLAVRRDGGFELVGRAPLAEARGCSLMAR